MMEPNIWMVRSGPEGGIDKLTRDKEAVAMGWAQVGDLSLLLALSDQEAQASLKNALTQASYTEEESHLVATQLLRFCQQIQQGDLVVAPTTKAEDLLLGLVTSDYEYAPNELSRDYPHLRRVEWRRQFWVNEVKGVQKRLSESNESVFSLNAYRDEIAKLDQLAYLRQAEEKKFRADRIRRFALTGFKAFKDTVWLPIQPITLLAGLNSSGKSSVIDALLLLTQTLRAEKRVAENIVLDWGGPFFEVDRFEEMVYDKADHRGIKIERVNKKISSDDLRKDLAISDYQATFVITFEIPHLISKQHSQNRNIKEHLPANTTYFWVRAGFMFEFVEPIAEVGWDSGVVVHLSLEAIDPISENTFIRLLVRDIIIDKEIKFSSETLESDMLNSLFFLSYFIPSLFNPIKTSAKDDENAIKIHLIFLHLFQPAIKTIQDELLYRIKYLGPLRDEPQRSYRQKRLYGIDVGASGEDAVLLLQRHWQKRVDFIELPEDSHEIVAWEKLFPVSMPLGEAVNEALRWLGMQRLRVQEGFGVVRADFATLSNPQTWVTIADVGFGVSQVLPVLVLGLLSETDSILIFEQPEIHLHPRAQARLGELLVCLAKTGRRILIETHSDHLINRLRRVVAEDLNDQLSDLVSLVFVQPPANGEGAKLSPLRVNEEGLIENWPEGFLAETASDARAIVKAGIRKRRMAKQKQA